MPPSSCCFCTHLNPARAKFCNECASPLHLKPCRQCDAVNPREAAACHRCAAPLAPAPRGAETSAERIVADADATLAALQRELVATAAPRGDVVVTADDVAAAMHEREDTGDAVDEAAEVPERPVGEPATLDAALTALRQRSQEGAAREPPVEAGVRAEDAFAAGNNPQAAPPETPVPRTAEVPAALAVDPADRQWRPERRSRAPAVLALLVLVAVLVAAYGFYNPAQVNAWLGRTSAPTPVDAALPGTTPAEPVVVSPAESPMATTAGDGAAAAVAADAAPVAAVAQDAAAAPAASAAPEANAAAPGPGASALAPAAAGVAAAATAAPERAAKAPSRAKSPSASGKSRERTTRPRPKASATQAPRRSEPPADVESSSRAEPCPPSVAALGLCNR